MSALSYQSPFTYREYPPHPALNDYVLCYWSLQANHYLQDCITSRSLSKGDVDLIFTTDGAFCSSGEQYLGENGHVRCYFVGPRITASPITSTGTFAAVGIRLLPGQGYQLLRTSLHELCDSVASVRDFWPHVSNSQLEQVADATDPIDRLAILEHVLMQRLAMIRNKNPVVQHALAIINSTRGQVSIDTLCSTIGISGRQLDRKFHTQVGVPPKRMCVISRIKYAIELARHQISPAWSDIALQSGFYDQAHFIRHFQSVTGLAPRCYFNEPTIKLFEY